MARWSAHHRKKAIFGWLAFAVLLFAVSFASPLEKIVFETSGPGESGRADTILYEDFKQPAGESVLIQSTSLTADDPAFKAVVMAAATGLSPSTRSQGGVAYDAGNGGQISADRHSVLVGVEIRGPSDEAGDKIDPIAARVAELQEGTPRSTSDRLARAPRRRSWVPSRTI